ncbi:hypothetical protein M405DRAFT_884670 [Rhizopogon salebrosus TDB-379]|nr:hypothetical protein M405DRAFT_884670 [Rhizopogon salebrosus TDB-379]
MGVLQSKLDDARDILEAENTPEDLTSKAEVFGFNAASGDDTASQYLADLVTHLGKLLEVVEAECRQKAKRLEESLANNQIPFELLEYYYEEGALYAANIGIQCNDLDAERRIVLVILKKACFKDNDDFRFRRMHEVNKQILSLEAEYLEWDGVCFQARRNLSFGEEHPHWDHRRLLRRAEPVMLTEEAYQGTRPITSLFLQRITEETLVKVTERGRLYLSYCRVFYAECYSNTNTQNELSHSDNSVKPCVRRVMIDPFGFHHAQQGYNPHQRLPLPVNTEDNIARFPYWIGGYDLDAHEWQTFRIWDLKPIEYDQEAWKRLIMDENSKDLIRALGDSAGRPLGTSYPGQFSKGKNILLKGPPGTGRMSTVHAVCNLFNRPLLTISADCSFRSNLESDLAQRVSLAVTWNAVIVVKDADVFLKSFDLERVHAVLRQFESDDCIAFWVTGSCGKEFLSSFCAVIDFPELNAAARRLENLSRYQLDGKTINNIMQSARALADANKEHFSVHHVKVVMKAQRLDILPVRRELTRILMLPAKLHKLVWWIK